jgi:hypothetical protein
MFSKSANSFARWLVVLPHIIISPTALVRVRVVVTVLATLAKVVLRVGNTVAAAATTTTICVMLGVVRITWVLVVCVAILISLNVLAILL